MHCFPCAFGDMAIVHKKSMVADKAEDYSFEGIAMYPASVLHFPPCVAAVVQ